VLGKHNTDKGWLHRLYFCYPKLSVLTAKLLSCNILML